MDRGGGQYCSDEGEFSLPEGVDLVGVESSRKSTSSSYQTQRRKKPPTWRAAVKLVVINMFVCALVLGYALIGSFVFLALENHRNAASGVQVSASSYPPGRRGANLTMAILSSLQSDQISKLKRDTVQNIWELTMSMNILYPDNWTKMTSEEVGNFQQVLLEKVLTVVENATVQETPYLWNFPRAFLFALTTLTTIGYGGIGPKTSSGKIATMIYAIFGIPIMLWYLSNVGSLLAKIARFFCAKICCCCCCREPSSSSSSSISSSSTRKVSDPYNYNVKPVEGGGELHRINNREDTMDDHHEHRVSICLIFILCVLVLLGYVCMGAWVVSRWEKWRYLDSFYFCFLTLTTISFGDSRSQKNGGLDRFRHRTEWFCSFYILFGMALTSMFFNILHEEISHRFKRWKHSPSDHSLDNKEQQASGHHDGVQKDKRRPVENSYSVHFMNFSSSNPTASRNFTEETLLSNEIHGRSMQDSADKNTYEEDDQVPSDSYMGHPIPPPREMYSTQPIFPR